MKGIEMRTILDKLAAGQYVVDILNSEGQPKLARKVARQTLHVVWLDYRQLRLNRKKRDLRYAMLETQYEMLIVDAMSDK